ncbi:hypothetical protein SALBM217S_02344 [Streptomyces griseoloalbus]|uniref:AAA family ATPase n=1 Tax=Streptomyces pseudogriseolus TaxID=36817 RepID=UPI001675FB5A|nr:AAA family ATPase [Streptomyces rubiginosus]
MIVRDLPTEDPWAETANPTQARLEQLRGALLASADLETIPDPEPLVSGVLYRDSLAWLYGKPGGGKSFLALDWAGCVAAGRPWTGREVSRGPVLYLVAEGSRGIRRRVRAWEQTTGQPMAGVLFLPVAVQLLHGTDRAALVALVGELQPALVVIDTQARVTVGAEENSNAEMGRVVAAADELREASGACVLMVHHTGRQGGNMRGASAFDGAASSVIRANRDGDWLDVICEKQKDDEDFPPIRLRMTRTADSLTLTATDPGRPAAATEGQAEILRELRQSFGSDGASASVLLKTTGASERTFYRDLKSLVTAGSVVRGGTQARPRYYLPEHAPAPSLPSLPTTATAAPH